MNWEAFFTLHRDLPREGPGLPEDVHWALSQIATPERVLDAACGPGADTVTLAQALPEAQITAIEKQAHFVEAARTGTAGHEHVTLHQGDMFAPEGPFDLIWCAGAVYFAGVTQALENWRGALASTGTVAFSHPVLPQGAGAGAKAFWADYPEITDTAGIDAQVQAAGYTVQATRLIVGAPWAAYFDPITARIAWLRSHDITDEVEEICAMEEREIALWRAAMDEVAYLLVVAVPNRSSELNEPQ